MKKCSLLLVVLLIVSSLLLPVHGEEKGFTPKTGTQELTADGIYLKNLDTGTVIYEKNADERLYPASLTKVMTAILAMESAGDLDTEIVSYPIEVQDYLYEYRRTVGAISSAQLVAGEEITMRDALYAIMLPSANEVAMSLAYHISGSVDSFSDLMNQRAAELGATNTHFVNPSGLHDDNHYSTARDIALLTEHALTLDGFKEITSTFDYSTSTNMHDELLWKSTVAMQDPNSTYYYPGLSGVKTGTIPESGFSFVSTAEKDGFRYLLVIIGANINTDANGTLDWGTNNAFFETKAIYDWVFSSFRNKTLINQGQTVDEVAVNLAWNYDFVQVVTGSHFSALVPSDLDTTDETGELRTRVELPEALDAPIQKGDRVGDLIYELSGEEIGRVELVAATNIPASRILRLWEGAKQASGSFWFKFIIVLIILFIVFYIILLLLRNRNKNRRRGKRPRPPRY